MIWLMMTALLAGAAATVAAVARMAFRAGHLLALRGPGGAPRLYERGADGRYAPRPAGQLLAALRRFARGVPAEARVRADR